MPSLNLPAGKPSKGVGESPTPPNKENDMARTRNGKHIGKAAQIENREFMESLEPKREKDAWDLAWDEVAEVVQAKIGLSGWGKLLNIQKEADYQKAVIERYVEILNEQYGDKWPLEAKKNYQVLTGNKETIGDDMSKRIQIHKERYG